MILDRYNAIAAIYKIGLKKRKLKTNVFIILGINEKSEK
jgi:hypothetical protein